MGRKGPRKGLACRVISALTRVFDADGVPHGCSAEHPNVSRRSAHPSIRVSEAKSQNPGRRYAPRERERLFEKGIRLRTRPRLSRVPDAVQRVTKWSDALLIRGRRGLEQSTQVGFNRLAG